jgi:predicted permease
VHELVIGLPMLVAFAAGVGVRGRLQRHFRLLFRVHFAAGVGLVGFLAGWSFHATVDNLLAVAVLLVAQVSAVVAAGRLFRRRADGPQLAFAMYGNPGLWALPVATATLGPAAAVFIATYDTLTQARIALGIRLLRRRAPRPQSARTALTDYTPPLAALAGLALGRAVPAPPEMPDAVAVVGVSSAVIGAHLLGVAWPGRRWIAREELRLSARALALHFTLAPAVLLTAALAGLHLPAPVWLVAFGPLPAGLVSFSRLYGYSTRLAATALTLSAAAAVALLPAVLAVLAT